MADERAQALWSRVGGFAVIVGAAIIVGYYLIKPSEDLKVFHPSDLDPRLVDPAVRNAEGEHRIMDFALVDQLGRTITLADVKGRIIIADFFFTTCATICPKMTAQMERVQEASMHDDRVVILSHSVTPEQDSVPVLADYAALHNADPKRWHFLTGDRKQIYALARRSYFACLDKGDGGPQDFVHTENFVLVDPLGRIRGFYDGTKTEEVDKLIGDIGKLLTEAEPD
ncbi:MAG: SCO family protein [Flavobacteriales bacterium]|nr:SCO family protein [Flavobacteriales bacterium]